MSSGNPVQTGRRFQTGQLQRLAKRGSSEIQKVFIENLDEMADDSGAVTVRRTAQGRLMVGSERGGRKRHFKYDDDEMRVSEGARLGARGPRGV